MQCQALLHFKKKKSYIADPAGIDSYWEKKKKEKAKMTAESRKIKRQWSVQ